MIFFYKVINNNEYDGNKNLKKNKKNSFISVCKETSSIITTLRDYNLLNLVEEKKVEEKKKEKKMRFQMKNYI